MEISFTVDLYCALGSSSPARRPTEAGAALMQIKEQIAAALPETVPFSEIERHLALLPERYMRVTNPATIATHIRWPKQSKPAGLIATGPPMPMPLLNLPFAPVIVMASLPIWPAPSPPMGSRFSAPRSTRAKMESPSTHLSCAGPQLGKPWKSITTRQSRTRCVRRRRRTGCGQVGGALEREECAAKRSRPSPRDTTCPGSV